MSLFDIFSTKKKKKILFIEDDMDLVRNFELFFNNDSELSQEYEFMFASDKREVLAKINLADAVISDYYLPDIKFEDIWKICAEKKPLVLVTGEITKRFTGLQVYKPVKLITLKKTVKSIFDSKNVCPPMIQSRAALKKAV